MSGAYYNEIDPFAAAWLRELVKAGHIAPGDVDERSIEDVSADDVKGYTQAHFFAGIGGWSYALRRAGWADTDPVWTGSCPCQSFSASGQGRGFDDARHLWPAWERLIRECRPDTILGEQVASAAGLAWFDVVSTDLEDAGYTVGAADLCAAGVGAPHIRQRLYFVADAECQQEHKEQQRPPKDERKRGADGTCGCRLVSDLANAHGRRCGEHGAAHDDHGRHASRHDAAGCGADGVLADAESRGQRINGSASGHAGHADERRTVGELGVTEGAGLQARKHPKRHTPGLSGPIEAGYWNDCVWLPCRDGKYRPTQPGLFPLAHGATARLGRLRGYGNAITAPLAQAFIESYLTIRKDSHVWEA